MTENAAGCRAHQLYFYYARNMVNSTQRWEWMGLGWVLGIFRRQNRWLTSNMRCGRLSRCRCFKDQNRALIGAYRCSNAELLERVKRTVARKRELMKKENPIASPSDAVRHKSA